MKTSTSRINMAWFFDRPDEAIKERRIKLLENSKRILSLLTEVIEDFEKEMMRPARREDYNEGWALRQAHKEGYRRALADLKNIMEIKPNG